MTAEDEQKWWNVINNIEKYVSRAEVEIATAEVLDRIKTITTNKKVAYAWSGGKDSLVIADLCKRAEIIKSFCLVTELEYPQWLKFLQENKPPNCEIINVGYDLDFIAKHSELLFAVGKLEQFWNINIRQKNFKKYIQKNKLEVLILGRRKIDGNFCGKKGLRLSNDNCIIYSPIFDWSHELLFAYMHYNKIELPFIYKLQRGFNFGTHLWVERDTFQEVYDIDPSIVIKAAEKIPDARKWLEERK